MTSLPKSDLVSFTRCRECDWQPDPDARASRVTQADRHGDEARHAVSYGMEPPQREDSSNAKRDD